MRHECNFKNSLDTLIEILEEEASSIEKIINDEDSSCPARELRRERAATLRWTLAIADNLNRWNW